MSKNLLQKVICEKKELQILQIQEITEFPIYYRVDSSDITMDYYDGLDIENTFDIYNCYRNMDKVSFLENEVIHNIIEYIKVDPDIFFASQVERIVLILKNKPIVIFINNNQSCDRTTLINLDKILEDNTSKFKFLRNYRINYKKIIPLGLTFISLSLFAYSKYKK
jgi:hypothetical protein